MILHSNLVHYLRGQTTTITPKWIGFEGISSTLQNMKTKLNQISGQVDGTFSGDGFLDTDPLKYQQSLDTLFNNYSMKTLSNPNPANSASSKPTVLPSYIKVNRLIIQLYGNSTTKNTAQYAIAQEYDATITASKTIVRQIKTYSSAIKQNIGDISAQIDGISNQINTLNNSISQFSTNVINNLINAVRYFNKLAISNEE